MEASFAASAAASAAIAGCSSESGSQVDNIGQKRGRAAVAGFSSDATRRASVREVVEMLGGMPWIKSGDHVLIKPAHNSPYPYPYTASPESCGELVALCLEAGARKVTVADSMGIEHTLVPGAFGALESPFNRTTGWGHSWEPDKDATVRAMHSSGLVQGIAEAIGNDFGFGYHDRVNVTSFRQHNWREYHSAEDTPGEPTMFKDWVKDQLRDAVNWEGESEKRAYIPRKFDLGWDRPGMMLPNLMDDVDHIINLHRTSTHIWSHATHSIKNWIGVQRPDERVWMHQLNYLKNKRHAPDDPASTECPYHEMLAELHMATWGRERLVIADAKEVILSGGPDGTQDPFYPANLMLGATDLVSADVLSVAVVKLGVLASIAEGGLDATCLDQPHNVKQLVLDTLGISLPWRDADEEFRGTDAKLCDPTFSPWDWLSIRRAIELGMGPRNAAELDLQFADDDFAVPERRAQFIEDEIALPTRFG
jgi:uncharacterized protein (DUF362 family)